MKIKQIYTGENDFSKLTLVKNNPFVKVEKFLSTLNESCQKNYYHNKQHLKIYVVDKMNFDSVDAAYFPTENVIYIENNTKYLTHELMHMASTDHRVKEPVSFSSHPLLENELMALEEGIAEFLSLKIAKEPITGYGINSFVAKMLYTTDSRIVVPFFCANSQKFLSMFSEIDILNVLNNLTIFHYNNFFGTDLNPEFEEQGYQECFYDLLDSLLDIELKKKRTSKEIRRYRDIFLSSLQEEAVKCKVEKFSEDYHNKAKRLIDSRLRRR